jgi:hypothetical protein
MNSFEGYLMRGLAVLVTALLAATGAQAADKPNILVIWGDDVGWFNISAYNHGMMGYKTPNIAELYRRSGGIHYRPVADPHGPDQGRPAGRKRRHE